MNIPVEKLPRWKTDKLMEVFTHPEKFLVQRRLKGSITSYSTRKVNHSPLCLSYDSIGYLPEHIPYEENGPGLSMLYSELWNPEWKGKVMEQDLPYWVISPTANELAATDQLDISGAITNLTKDELDKVYNFLLPIVESGQYKCFWFKYGDAVTFLTTREVYMGSVCGIQ